MSVVTECVSVSVSEPEYVPALESQRHDLREPMVAGVSVVPVATVIGGDFVIFIFVVIIVVRGGTVLFFIISFFDVKGLFNIGDGRASIVGTLNGLIDIHVGRPLGRLVHIHGDRTLDGCMYIRLARDGSVNVRLFFCACDDSRASSLSLAVFRLQF